MSDETYDSPEQFSLNKYVKEWSKHRDTVAVEGTCHEDGDYYVIDQDPGNPGKLLRVRRGDVIDREKLDSTKVRDREHHLYRVYVKREAPVVTQTIITSDDLDDAIIARRMEGASARRPIASQITESGNPAPSSGWYVEVLVLSTGRTWYYGPYSYQDSQVAFRDLNNPDTQWTALPQYIEGGTMLQPW